MMRVVLEGHLEDELLADFEEIYFATSLELFAVPLLGEVIVRSDNLSGS